MSKQVLSVRDFALLYKLLTEEINHKIARASSDPFACFRGDSSKSITPEEIEDKLAKDTEYQDLLRLRDAIGSMQIEIETPDVLVVDAAEGNI